MRAGIRTRWVGIGVLTVVTAVGATAAPSWSAGSAGRAAPEPGAVVVADQEQGAVLALGRDGRSQVVLDELGAVRGVVVLSDGTVVAADSEAGTLVATAGRFGDDRVELATGLESPEGLAVAGGGRLYVTSFSEGTLSRVDISSGRVESLAADLDGPSAVLAQREPRPAARVAVAEWFGGRVADLRRTGSRAGALVRGLERPAGLALDGDGVLYVSDRAEGTVTAVDLDGARRVVVELDAPAGLALDPAAPAAGQSYDLVVATAAGVVRVDPGSGATDELDPLPTGVGLVVAPDEFIVAGAPATPVAEAGRAAGGAAGGGDPVVAASGADVDPVLVGLIAIAVFLAGIAVVSGVQLWRGRGDEEEEGGDRFVGMSRGERRRARRTARRPGGRAQDRQGGGQGRSGRRSSVPEPGGGAEGPSAPPSRACGTEAERRRGRMGARRTGARARRPGQAAGRAGRAGLTQSEGRRGAKPSPAGRRPSDKPSLDRTRSPGRRRSRHGLGTTSATAPVRRPGLAGRGARTARRCSHRLTAAPLTAGPFLESSCSPTRASCPSPAPATPPLRRGLLRRGRTPRDDFARRRPGGPPSGSVAWPLRAAVARPGLLLRRRPARRPAPAGAGGRRASGRRRSRRRRAGPRRSSATSAARAEPLRPAVPRRPRAVRPRSPGGAARGQRRATAPP
ncbi:MAG: hypothetical protein H6518_04025 [Microthrixaceae bacterium]|nr:hypothetical protein [Microthrixaceae bacterium]